MTPWTISARLTPVAPGFLLVGCASASYEGPRVEQLEIGDAPLFYQINGGPKRAWDLPANFKGQGDGPFTIGYVPFDGDVAIFGVDLSGTDRATLCISFSAQRRCFTVTSQSRTPLILATDTARFRVRLQAQSPAATYSDAFLGQKQNAVETRVPEFYELLNIAIALTDVVDDYPDVVPKDTAYFDRLAKAFEGFTDHPLIKRLNADLAADPLVYYVLRSSGLSYEFDRAGRIAPSATYRRGGFPGSQINDLDPYIDDLQAFANETDFRSFYAQNEATYAAQIGYFEGTLNVAQMLDWLGDNFPDADPPDYTQIILSPLAGSVQFLNRYSQGDFRELQPHINYPYSGFAGLSEEARPLARGSLLFTELNHGFIEPPESMTQARDEAFERVEFWIAQDSDAEETYGTPELVFDEYVNWSLLSLYMRPLMQAEDWNTFRASIRRTMTQRRGFVHFEAFEEAFVTLDESKAPGTPVANLFPALIDWAKEYQRAGTHPSPSSDPGQAPFTLDTNI